MIGPLGIWELLIILVILVLLFGHRLPQIGAGLGKGIRSFRKSMRESDEIDVTPRGEDKKDQEKEDAP